MVIFIAVVMELFVAFELEVESFEIVSCLLVDWNRLNIDIG